MITRRGFLKVFGVVAAAAGLGRFVQAKQPTCYIAPYRQMPPDPDVVPTIVLTTEPNMHDNRACEVLTVVHTGTGDARRYCLPDIRFKWQMEKFAREAYSELGVEKLWIEPQTFAIAFFSFMGQKPPYLGRAVTLFRGGWSDFGLLSETWGKFNRETYEQFVQNEGFE